ncbi:MAG: acetyl-CoA carboxylase biotin carboxyl carrier protein [Gemmatimonadales bacterium]|jgi:acetyl-CoA carboxylase biotin carboxyl carrier protein|nr:MAG: acetyl-CoA carboxylase biotin carboxyl carrier protein [Gemmatimonadales bacterium]
MMMDLSFIKSLIKAVDQSSIDSVDIERGGTRVRISKTPPSPSSGTTVVHSATPAGAAPLPVPAAPVAPTAPAEAPAPDASGSGLAEIPSPMVGTFYSAPAPDAPPYVKVGQKVGVGDTLCIIEAMKLMNELEAEVAGTIAEICVQNADPVEYGQVLFRIDPA